MGKIIIDLSGRGGLLERYQGDLNSTSPTPHLRYLGGDDQFADGIWNPFSYYGYSSPATNTFTSLTGTIAAPINVFAYDNASEVLFLAEEGTNILQLSNLEDVSVANYKTISAGTIKDLIRYELNNEPALFYIIDSGNTIASGGDGIHIGMNFIESTQSTPIYDNTLREYTSNLLFGELVDASSDTATVGITNDKRKWAQSFNTSQVSTSAVELGGIKAVLSREGGTGSGITLQVSVQANAVKTDAKFTNRGTWSSSSISYAVNDVVTQSGTDYLCYQAHTSSASDTPGTTGGFSYWNEFGEPTGTALASGTFTLDELSDLDATSDTQFQVLFTSTVSLSASTKYWIVIEESGSNMTATDKLGWLHSVNNSGINTYRAKGYYTNNNVWVETRSNQGDKDHFDLTLVISETEHLSDVLANGAFDQDTNVDSFFFLSDNGLLYWFAGNSVNAIDGTSTGGVTSTVFNSVLLFPSFTNITDVAETRGRQYIGVQTSERSTTLDTNFFNAYRSGVYVWDRRSQIMGGSDFFPTPGAKEIRNLFTSSTGDVVAITVGNSGFTELRELSGNQFAVVQTLEKDAYPESRKGISQVGNMSIWLGRNGIFYAFGAVAPGEPQRLFKIGTAAGLTDFSLPGAIFVGNKDSSNNELAVYFGWSDSGPGYNISKWYPNGEGTIDSNAQKANQGNVYTRVQQMPGLSTIQYIRGFHMPGGADGDATVAGTLKCYVNQSSTASWSRSITYDDLYKGWFEKEWNKPNVNFLQFEIEWNSTPTIGSSTYRPMYLEIQTQDEGRINS